MGDDLNFAQKFTRTAADGLALIAEMENPRAVSDAAIVVDMMTTVQRGAKRLRARHIYSGAQDVLSALHHENDAILSGRINNLGSVVTEYARGLDDLLQAQQTLSPPKSPVDKWDTARETLNALLPIASPDDADMLSRLMRAPVTIETVQPGSSAPFQEADIVPFIKLDKPASIAEDAIDHEAIEVSAPLPTTTITATESPTVALDAMMRDVIADALSVARSIGRTISLSYDMGERAVTELRARDLRARLSKALSQIIRQSLTDDRVGHIDINLAGEQLHVMAGTTALRIAIDPSQAPVSKPLITPETETGLRAQLDALMDPVTRHETAS